MVEKPWTRMLGVRRGLTPISQTICPALLTIAYPPHTPPCPPRPWAG